MRKLGVLMVLVFWGVAMAAPNMTIQADKDPFVDFSEYSTYDWLPLTDKDNTDPMLRNEDIVRFIKRAVEREISDDGFQKATIDFPDLQVIFYGNSEAVKNPVPFQYGLGNRWNYVKALDIRQYPPGTFIIDIVDRRMHKLAWRGWATNVITDDPKKLRSNLNDAIIALMDRFPNP